MYGLEAGQSAVGDIFNWFVRHLTPGRYGKGTDAHASLTREAERLRPGESGLLALDWNNGNRTILVDPLLTGLLVGQTLHSSAPEIYRALVEATAFGGLTIINRFEEYGVKVSEVVTCGGISEKTIPFLDDLGSLADGFETRKIVFYNGVPDGADRGEAILQALKFEYLWYLWRRDTYGRLSREDDGRIEKLATRFS